MGNSYTKIIGQYDLLSNSSFGLIAENAKSVKLTYMKEYNFERILVDVLAELIEKRGLKHKPTAMRAWPDRKDAATKWRKIRNGEDPRGLQVQDAYDMAAAINVSFVEVCGIAQARLLDACQELPLERQGDAQLKNERQINKKSYNQGNIPIA